MDFKDAFFKEEFIDAVSALEWHHYQEKVLYWDGQHSCKLQSLLCCVELPGVTKAGSYGEG